MTIDRLRGGLGRFAARPRWRVVLAAVILLEAGLLLAYQKLQDPLPTKEQPAQEAAGRGNAKRGFERSSMTEADSIRETATADGLVSPWGTPLAENVEGGYRFGVPPGWDVEGKGTTTEVSSPDGETIISFGFGLAGSPGRSTQRLVDLLDRSYDDVRVSAKRATTIVGRRTVVAQGSAMNQAGIAIGFRIYSVRFEPHNFAIAAFQRGADTWGSSDVVDDIAGSFRAVGR